MKRLRFFLILALYLSIPSNVVESTELKGNVTRLEVTRVEILTYFYCLWRNAWHEVERAAWITRDEKGEYAFWQWQITPERMKNIWKGSIPRNTVALVHTHPQTVDPKPSEHDKSNAVRLKIQIYTISRSGIWIAKKDGTIRQEAGLGWYKQIKLDLSNPCTRWNHRSRHRNPS